MNSSQDGSYQDGDGHSAPLRRVSLRPERFHEALRGMANGVGVIDSQYRGEVAALLHNGGGEPYQVRRGSGAQLVVLYVELPLFRPVSALRDPPGRGRFGSTGT